MTRKQVYFAGIAACAILPSSASAETLQQALEGAYRNNPTISAQRASIRVAEEDVPLARAAGMPTVDGSATYQENVLTGKPAPSEQRPSIGCNIKWKPGNEPAYLTATV